MILERETNDQKRWDLTPYLFCHLLAELTERDVNEEIGVLK